MPVVKADVWYGECHEGSSHKFYTIAVIGEHLARLYGRCPGYGITSRITSSTDVFSDARNARIRSRELADKKYRKGYQKVEQIPQRIITELQAVFEHLGGSGNGIEYDIDETGLAVRVTDVRRHEEDEDEEVIRPPRKVTMKQEKKAVLVVPKRRMKV